MPEARNVEKGGIPLAVLLWVDQQYASPATLPACLGDSYLYAINPVFRGVRDEARALGIEFREDTGFLGRTYGIAPLLALDEIFSAGVVPYRGDAELLKHIVESRPQLQIDALELKGLVAGHTIMHESAHLIADRILTNEWKLAEDYSDTEPVLRSLLGESFANAVEAVGNIFVTQGSHMLLWHRNSYLTSHGSALELMQACASAFTPTKLFELALWIYFHLNVRSDTNDCGSGYLEACALSVFGDLALTPGERSIGQSIGPSMFGLSRGFRADTTPAYFRLRGSDEGLRVVRGLDLESPQVLKGIALPEAARLLSSLFDKWTRPPGAVEQQAHSRSSSS